MFALEALPVMSYPDYRGMRAAADGLDIEPVAYIQPIWHGTESLAHTGMQRV